MAPNNLTDPSALVFTVSEVSTLLQISRAKIYMMIHEGILEGVKIGCDWRVKRSSLERVGGFAAGRREDKLTPTSHSLWAWRWPCQPTQ